MNIGENIKIYRKERNLTQSQLSKLSNIPVITLGRYERGERTPNIDILRKIATALQIPIDILCGLNIEPIAIPNENLIAGFEDKETGKFIEDLNEHITNILQAQEKEIIKADAQKIFEEVKKNMIIDEDKEHFKNIDELSNYKELFFISRLLNSIFKNLDMNLTIITNEKVAKLQLTDNKDGYTKIFNTLEEAETFFDEINHGIQSSVDRLKYYDKNNK